MKRALAVALIVANLCALIALIAVAFVTTASVLDDAFSAASVFFFVGATAIVVLTGFAGWRLGTELFGDIKLALDARDRKDELR